MGMVEGWKGNEKRVTREPRKQHGGHRKPGGVVVPAKDKPEPKDSR